MPYVKSEIRERLDNWAEPVTPEELAYLITTLLNQYCATRIPSYELYNSIVGMLESTKLEFYRRVIVPSENSKIRQNGDVFSKEITEEKL